MAWLYQQKTSANWWVGWRVGKKAFFKSTGTPDRAQAEKELAKVNALFQVHKSGSLLEEVYKSLSGDSRPKTTLTAALADWLTECRGSTKASTLERYNSIADALKRELGATASKPILSDVTREHVRSYLNKRRETSSASTVNLERKILSVFFRRALANGLIRENPALGVKPFKAGADEVTKRRAFTTEELRLLFSKAPNDFWRYMIVAGFYLGQRMGDLIRLTRGNVDMEANIVRLRTGKTDQVITVPMATPLRAIIAARLPMVGPKATSPLWPEESDRYLRLGSKSFSNEFYSELLAPSGLVKPRTKGNPKEKNGRSARREMNDLSFHCVRHSFVSYLKITGSHQSTAKALAGHSNEQMSDLYTHVPIEVLAEAIKALPEVGT